ncbi:MAG TPA: hypothetical protein VFF09_05445 [archaeon]|nr:hypothetical protein [archaeon]
MAGEQQKDWALKLAEGMRERIVKQRNEPMPEEEFSRLLTSVRSAVEMHKRKATGISTQKKLEHIERRFML